MTVLTIFMFESHLIQMPGPRDIVILGPPPGHFLLCKSPGAGHTFRGKSLGVPGRGGRGGGDGNRSNWYLDKLRIIVCLDNGETADLSLVAYGMANIIGSI